jgi:surface protein
MFSESQFNGDVGNWNVSNVTNMSHMFWSSRFNGDISQWDVSNVTDMSYMFSHSQFNGDISKWNISDNANVIGIFEGVENNQQKDNLDAVQNLYQKILDSAKDSSSKLVANDKYHLKQIVKAAIVCYGSNCDLNFIDVSRVTDMSFMFSHSPFNGDISKWNVSNVTDMSKMFYFSEFNGDISQWDVSNVTNMSGMFNDSPLEKNPPKWYKDKGY